MGQARGQLTDRVLEKARDLLGYDISRTELRLMPYASYVMQNEQCLDIRKINQEERDIISSWREKGFIDGGASGMSMTKDFWDKIHQIIWLAYVDLFD